jgi:hypothetical protein
MMRRHDDVAEVLAGCGGLGADPALYNCLLDHAARRRETPPPNALPKTGTVKRFAGVVPRLGWAAAW